MTDKPSNIIRLAEKSDSAMHWRPKDMLMDTLTRIESGELIDFDQAVLIMKKSGDPALRGAEFAVVNLKRADVYTLMKLYADHISSELR